MLTNEQRQAIINALVALRENATDAIASENISIYPTLKGNGKLIRAGIRINHGGKILRAAVDLWDTAENSPENAPALWEEIEYREGIRIIPDVITAGKAFYLGELGWWGETLYRSKVEANVYTPAAYPPNWEEVEPDGA